MKIYIGSSTSQFSKYSEYYLAIRKFLIEEGHIITRDWIGKYKDILMTPKKVGIYNEYKEEDWYQKALNAVKTSNVLILEDTVSSFSNGHLMTIALQRKIPVLALRIRGEKIGGFSNSFISGIKSDYLQITEYDLNDYKNVINGFMKKYEDSYKRHRFHLVIDEVEKRYLDFASHRGEDSKTQIIRKAIRDAMQNDMGYREYLEK